MKKLVSILLVVFLLFSNLITGSVYAAQSSVGVAYESHVQNIGWQAPVSDGQTAGTEGMSLRMEALKINLTNAPAGASIKYESHVSNIGWQSAVIDGQITGTVGQGQQMEAIRITLVNMPGYSVKYQVHVAEIGWQSWTTDGQMAGTSGRSLKIEAIRISIVKISDNSGVAVQYQGHVQNIGWQTPVFDGQVTGTEGMSLRMEALKVKLLNAPAGAGIQYRAHVSNIGWQNAVSDGQIAGTVGQGQQMEAIEFTLMNMPGYSVQYQAHVANIGWQPWVADGQMAGTTGRGLKIEAIRIRIISNSQYTDGAAAVTAYENAPITTLTEVAAAESLKATADKAVAAVGNATERAALEQRIKERSAIIAAAKAALEGTAQQMTAEKTAETAVAAYESAPITTLVEVTLAEGQKAAADTAVAAVTSETARAAFESRVMNRSAAIAAAKAALEETARQAAAETKVVAYEAAPLANLAEISSAEALKPAADAAADVVTDVAVRAAFENRIVIREEQIAYIKTSLLAFEADAQAAAETAVSAFEAAALANQAQINTATGLKNTADSRVASIADITVRDVFMQRITIKTMAMAIAETNLYSFLGSIEPLIKYNTIFELNFTDYDALADKAPVHNVMIDPNFTSAVDIKITFDNAVALQKALEVPVVTAFNNAANSTDIASAITTYASVLSLGLTEYSAVIDKTPIHTELIGRGFTTAEEIKAACIIAVINHTNAAGVRSLLNSNSSVLGLALTTEYTSSPSKSLIETAVIAARPIADKLEIVVNALNSTNTRAYIGQLLTIDKLLLGLDLTDYHLLNNLDQMSVQDDLMAADLGNKADVQQVFSTSVAARKSDEDAGVAAFNNAADAAAIEAAIAIYIHNNDKGTYTPLANKLPVHTDLLVQHFTSMTQISTAFNNAVADQKVVEDAARVVVNHASTTDEMNTALTIHAVTLGLDLTDYNSFSAGNKLPVQTTMIADTFYSVSFLKTTFAGAVASQKAVIAINGADAASMGSHIITNAEILALTTDDYLLLTAPSRDIVHTALAGKAFADKTAVQTAFETAVSVPIINEIVLESAMNTALFRYAEVLGLNLTDYGALFAPYNTTVQTTMLAANFVNAAEVKIAFDVAVASAKVDKAVAALNNAVTTTEINTAITANASILGLTLTDYTALVNKEPVQTAMLAAVFATAADVKMLFDEEVAIQAINEAVFDGMGTALTSNADDLGLILIDYTALIDKEPVHTAMLSPVFTTAEGVKTVFDTAVADQKAIEDLLIPSVTLNKSSLTLHLGTSETLSANTWPADTVTWISDNPAVASVDANGSVLAESSGTAVITVTTDGAAHYTDTCTVTVIVPATGVSLNKTRTIILVGSNESLIATVSPAGATNTNILWTSETTRAAVDSTGKVTGVTAGVGSYITATTVDGSFTATCYVRVISDATLLYYVNNGIYTDASGTFDEYAFALGLDMTDYNALGWDAQTTVQTALKNTSPDITTVALLRTAFYRAVAVEEINMGTLETMGAVIDKNAVKLGLNLTSYNLLANKEIVHVILVKSILNTGPFAASTDVKTAFDSAVAAAPAMEAAIAEINAAELDTMDAAIVNNAVTLGLDLTSYNAYTDKAAIQALMITPVFTNQTQVQTALDIFSAKAITLFDFNDIAGAVGMIDNTYHEVWIGVPFETDRTSLVPTIVHTGISITPDSLIPTDFSSPDGVIYTVTAADGSTQDWTVYVY